MFFSHILGASPVVDQFWLALAFARVLGSTVLDECALGSARGKPLKVDGAEVVGGIDVVDGSLWDAEVTNDAGRDLRLWRCDSGGLPCPRMYFLGADLIRAMYLRKLEKSFFELLQTV
jgi:hypothetical protein